MKKLLVILPVVFFFGGISTLLNAQTCNGDDISIQENDFPQTCISTDPTDGANTTETFTYEAGYAANGMDDVMVTMTADCPPSATGNGTTFIGACLGPNGLNATTGDPLVLNQSGGSDFGYTTINDADCASCYVEVCYEFINGFNSSADGLDIDWSSMNGGTEAQESFVGWIEGTNTTTGATLPSYTSSTLLNYCYADVLAGQSASQFLTGTAAGGTLPPGAFGADAVTGDGVPTACPTEEPGSSSGPNSTVSTGQGDGVIPPNWGFPAGEEVIVTKLCMIYFGSNNNTSDCNMDGVNEANSTPSGSLAAVDICLVPVCTITNATATAACDTDNPDNAIVTVTFDEENSSGTFNILDAAGATVGTATGTGVGITSTFTVTGPTTAMTGVMYTIEDGMESTCTIDVMVDIPECVAPPCPDYTAMLSGDGQICNSGSVDLSVAMSDGTAPYTVVINDGASDTTITGYNSGDAISVSPTATTTYSIVSVLDADGCPAMVSGTAEVTVIMSCANAGSINGSGN